MLPIKKILYLQISLVSLLLVLSVYESGAQVPTRQGRPNLPIGENTLQGINNSNNASKDTIGFEHRNDAADSITISYRIFDSLGTHRLDTTINDFGKFYTLPTGYISIGGNGNAAFPILFSPEAKPGWDPGFHAFDVYKYTLSNTRFYQTTRPFTSMNYYLGGGKEQVIKILHTQNIKPNWNAGINFRLISNPGVFQNQNVKDNNYRFFSSYQGRRKRYAAEVIILGNKLVSAENGGISDPDLLADPNRKRRIAIPVNLGDNANSSNQIFSSKIKAGNRYGDFEFFLRQRYDIGKKDSLIINDSTTEYLFYPKLRFQHTIHHRESSYQFIDYMQSFKSNITDSAFLGNNYNFIIRPNGSSFFFMDEWKYLSNDLSIKQFPETKNQSQFIEAGLRLENYSGSFTRPFIPDNILVVFPKPAVEKNYFNAVLHGEYRNKTRNQKWDASLSGEFFVAGFYAGEYSAAASVQRYLNPKWGTIRASFENTSRSPSFVFQSNSAFNLDSTSLTKKENITILTFQAVNRKFQLMARNISITNYAYLTNYYQKDQYTGLINLTQGSFSIKNKITGHLNIYSDFIVQQTAGNNPIKVPLFYTRQRLAFEGHFFKNLNLSTGLDINYNTPYKANNYSPVLGRFFPQDSTTISNLPTVSAFFNFQIKTFRLFIKGENLNTVDFKEGFGFTNNSFTAPYYPTPGFILRFGIKWDMVN